MELRHLATFHHAARSLNFTASARALNYVQSNVSAHVQALEDELGVELFDRSGRRVALTAAGTLLLPFAERILLQVEEARSALARDAEPAGTITIAAPETICAYRLPQVLRVFRDRYPAVQAVVQVMSGDGLARAVAAGDIEMGLVLDRSIVGGTLAVEVLVEEEMVLVAAPDHPLVGCDRVATSALGNEVLLLTEPGCAYRAALIRRLAEASTSPRTLEFGSVEAIKRCVGVGVGIALLPAVTVDVEVARGSLTILPWSLGVTFETQLVHRRDRWRSPAAVAFGAITREVMAGGRAA